jgi:hypothetical protein
MRASTSFFYCFFTVKIEKLVKALVDTVVDTVVEKHCRYSCGTTRI